MVEVLQDEEWIIDLNADNNIQCILYHLAPLWDCLHQHLQR